jgi:conjugative relaxase-like TrwC/TraI family protein
MLSIGKLGIGQERYYLDKVAEGAEDYYSGEGEAEGQWLGDAAKELGLDGAVEAEQLTAMLTGRNPATGEPLGLRAVGGRGAVPGFDLTFSVPKSASLLWALGDAETSAAVTAATESALGAALDYLQREACWTRRGADAEYVKGNGFLAAGFRHRSSRAGDPQVHIHTLIANVTKDRMESGPGSTTQRSTTTPRRRATSSRPTSAPICPAASGSVGRKSATA